MCSELHLGHGFWLKLAAILITKLRLFRLRSLPKPKTDYLKNGLIYGGAFLSNILPEELRTENSMSHEMCPGLNSSTKFTKLHRFTIIVIFVKFAVLVEPLSSKATCQKDEEIFMLYFLYLPTKICGLNENYELYKN